MLKDERIQYLEKSYKLWSTMKMICRKTKKYIENFSMTSFGRWQYLLQGIIELGNIYFSNSKQYIV
jgi:hypothetical protein